MVNVGKYTSPMGGVGWMAMAMMEAMVQRPCHEWIKGNSWWKPSLSPGAMLFLLVAGGYVMMSMGIVVY